MKISLNLFTMRINLLSTASKLITQKVFTTVVRTKVKKKSSSVNYLLFKRINHL